LHLFFADQNKYNAVLVKFKEWSYFLFSFSHIVAQVLDCYASTFYGATLYYANPDVFKGTLTKTLVYAQPTIFFAVPRVWEKIEEKISENLQALTGLKASLFKWATKTTLAHKQASFNHESKNILGYKIADRLVLSKIKQMLGLHKARIAAVGAAPFSRKTNEFFLGLGITIIEAFGMSETTGGIINCLEGKIRFGSVGFLNNFTKIKIAEPDKTGNGEVCMYGRNMFMGYLNSPAKTQEMFDADGYLHSGDIGKIDEDGFLFITGRIKELIITAGGENVAPIPIEDAVKEELPGIVSNSMVVGDKRKYLTLLITLKVGFFLNLLL
jgi:long-chain-fatty-acid--CoA ligase ACSBG